MEKITVGAIITKPGSSTKYKTGGWSTYRPVLVVETPPCNNACPAGVDARGYIRLIQDKRYDEALELVREKIPLPGVVGRVCHHPCEEKCYRGKLDAPVSICTLKRFIADCVAEKHHTTPSKIQNKKNGKVAIIGSGPAGLSAAYKLAKIGYSVTIFEALPVEGGMLRVGIPDYRLPKNVLKNEIDAIKALGVEIKLNTPVKDTIALKEQYNAVFIAAGAQKNSKLNIPGEELDGVIHGLDFLQSVNLGKPTSIWKNVAIIGGGNVAIDVARSVIRTGAQSHILYRRTREEMPAIKEDIDEAEREGVHINYLVSPKRILGSNKVTGIECIRMSLGEPDESGRRRPVPIEGSEFVIDVDTVIPAVGQYPDFSFTKGRLKTENQMLIVDPKTFSTNQPGIFAGGDIVTGPATVIEAIAAGMKAATCIDRYIAGDKLECEESEAPPLVEFKEMNLSMVETKNRTGFGKLSIDERKSNYKEVNHGFTEQEALEEAERCLSCGCCRECELCYIYCPDIAIKMGEKGMNADYDYCKGCGICANECRCGVIKMKLGVK